MGSRGTYKYICDECGVATWLSVRERNSRFKPRCSACGSLWLEPSSSSKGPDKITEAQDAAKQSIDQMNKKMGIE